MLLRGGRRVALPEWAVVAFEVAGEGVEAGGEEDTVVAVVAPEGSDKSVNKDMVAGLGMQQLTGGIFQVSAVCL